LGTAGSATSLEDLKAGLCQAVLLGREPEDGELEGLQDIVIAYDAVCILVDENSYLGGEIAAYSPNGVKTDGLRELSSDQLIQLMSFWMLDASEPLTLSEGIYKRQYPFDYASRTYLLIDPETGEDLGEWVADSRSLQTGFYFPPGKYDTQSAMYQALGLDEVAVTVACPNYRDPDLYREEEMLSFEYMTGAPYAAGTGVRFSFKRVLPAAHHIIAMATSG
jgi:hypothetical protein